LGKRSRGVKFVLEKGAQTNIKIRDGIAVLHFATQRGDIKMMEILQERRMPGIYAIAVNEDGPIALSLLRQSADSAGELIESFGALLLSINPTSRAGRRRSCPADETSNGEVEEPLVDAVGYM
jgi:hypothetical protein